MKEIKVNEGWERLATASNGENCAGTLISGDGGNYIIFNHILITRFVQPASERRLNRRTTTLCVAKQQQPRLAGTA